MYTAKDQTDWDEFISSVLFAYRISQATSSTKFSPFQLLYGRMPRLPIDVSNLVNAQHFKTAQEHLKDILRK